MLEVYWNLTGSMTMLVDYYYDIAIFTASKNCAYVVDRSSGAQSRFRTQEMCDIFKFHFRCLDLPFFSPVQWSIPVNRYTFFFVLNIIIKIMHGTVLTSCMYK